MFQYVEFSGAVENHAGSSPQKLKCESEFVTSLERGQIAAGDTEIWDDVCLEVPAIPPSRLVGCDIINISYVVKVGRRCDTQLVVTGLVGLLTAGVRCG